jgi:hypothetical protein
MQQLRKDFLDRVGAPAASGGRWEAPAVPKVTLPLRPPPLSKKSFLQNNLEINSTI